MARRADPAKRENIIRAATRTFAGKGYAATRIIDVARCAGIGKGTIYEYFKSKEDLFFAVFQQVMQDTEVPIAASVSRPGSVDRRLRALAESLIGSWLEKLELYSLVMEFWSAAAASASRDRFKDAFRNGYQGFRRSIAALIEEGMAAGEFSPECRPYEVASGLIGMWDAMLLQAWADDTFDALEAVRPCMDTMLDGLRRTKRKETP
jgi:AcrR family transcriptional regulator